ncbi:hypothetical protein KEM48_002310 [Puccinia striiformis f. sp. tritici PST-130]|nr:hypothetical protein KEM48_002310 [Puccinia striiformis f. sp. tritici PST-130]
MTSICEMLVIISNSRHNQKNHVDFRFQLHAKHAPDVIEHHENFKSIWLLKSENKSDTVPGTCGQVPAILVGHPCQTFSLSARSTRRRAGQKQAGELVWHRDFHLPSTKARSCSISLRQTAIKAIDKDSGPSSIANPKDNLIRKLARRLTDTLVAELSNVGTNEDKTSAKTLAQGET